MTAYLAASLVALRNSVNVAFPHRDKASDGWIGNAAHAARQSEHNPDSKGCVHAIDVDIDDGDTGRDLRMELLSATLRHPAVWYVITNGVIYSRTYGWTPRRYTGSNGHFQHVHISVLLTAAAERDVSLKLRPVVAPASPPKDLTVTEADRIIAHINSLEATAGIEGQRYAQIVNENRAQSKTLLAAFAAQTLAIEALTKAVADLAAKP